MQERSDGFRVQATKTEPEKVANTVGTFLSEGSDGFQVQATKTASENVAYTVATF